MSLYFLLLFGSILIPFLLSFDKKLQFYKKWKFVFPSLLIIALFFLVFDVYLTKHGVWGFNNKYLSEIYILNLPLEEWFFFIFIPYASLFLHFAFVLYFPQIKISDKITKVVSAILISILIYSIIRNYEKAYTLYISIKLLVVMILSLFFNFRILKSFFLSFILILIPFTIVNGILTGSCIEEEVVWYNNLENIDVRFFSIPVEDFAYAFSMILANLLLIKFFEQRFQSSRLVQ